MKNPPIIKLLKLYAFGRKYKDEFNEHFICCGIWETRSVKEEDGKRVYEFSCVAPFDFRVKTGDTRRMYEEVIIALCDEIEIVRKPIKEQECERSIATDDDSSTSPDHHNKSKREG